MASSSFQTLHRSLTETISGAFPGADVKPLYERFNAAAGSEADRRATVDQTFRDMFVQISMVDAADADAAGNDSTDARIGAFVNFAVAASRLELSTAALPVVLMSDLFDMLPLDRCERSFAYVEDNVAVWREPWIFAACKNNLLRMCNDLLRRLSRSQNTVFCGRILLFLAKFFPFSERSGLNVVSEFNLENLTEYETDAAAGSAIEEGGAAAQHSGELDKSTEEAGSEEVAIVAPVKIDHTLYCQFWALQDFFRNPNQCYSKAQWEAFAGHASSVLAAFTSFKLEESRGSGAVEGDGKSNYNDSSSNVMDVDGSEASGEVRDSQHFFAKFLTNPKLLTLQLSDSNFRRSVLVQFLILFQYLRSTVKFKAETFSLTAAQSDYIRDTDVVIYRLLEETPPNGQKFAATVRHILEREEMWNSWKNDGCKEFSRPSAAPAAAPATTTPDTDAAAAPMKAETPATTSNKLKRRLGDLVQDSIAQKRFYMGSPELTRLWNICPDNLQACRGADRNFLPSIETYLENPKDKTDPSFEWRALRLLARQSPHFFSLTQTPNKVSDYLEGVRKKIHESKTKAAAPAAAAAAAQAKIAAQPVSNGAAAAKLAAAATASTAPAEVVVVESPDPDHNVDEPMSASGGAGGGVADEDDHNTHKIAIVTAEQMAQVAGIIGGQWQKVGRKIGYTPDVLKFIEDKPSIGANEKCLDMLRIWFEEDEDANLDNLAYMLEGLELAVAAEAIKRLLEPADKMEDVSE